MYPSDSSALDKIDTDSGTVLPVSSLHVCDSQMKSFRRDQWSAGQYVMA